MDSTSHPNGIFNRDDNAFQLFQNYMRYCSDEQVTLNNILHTQNLLSNNRYNMFNQMFRFINHDNDPLNSWSNTPFTPPNMFTPRTRIPRVRINRRQFNTDPTHPIQQTFRPIHFPGHNHPRRTTINPLTEFINETLNDNNTRRRPTTIRQFFDSCSVFIYSSDLSNNQIHCPITMLDFNTGDICIRLPCNHIFKYRPLLQWLTTARTCPMCRLQIPHSTRRSTSNNPIDVDTNNVSIQTSDISNGFIADISANSIEDLSQALSQTVTTRIQNLFNNMDISGNIPMAWSTNISLVTPRNHRQSPINNLIITSDSSGNIDINHIFPDV
ncbi:hypothetical protein OAA99_02915 [Omnitrophica bacterium]|nr:hypothetical protein [Candidatus Omnitrophota bacterium]